ncbi:unnamed protein product, partial [marine sediment metagenome]
NSSVNEVNEVNSRKRYERDDEKIDKILEDF